MQQFLLQQNHDFNHKKNKTNIKIQLLKPIKLLISPQNFWCFHKSQQRSFGFIIPINMISRSMWFCKQTIIQKLKYKMINFIFYSKKENILNHILWQAWIYWSEHSMSRNLNHLRISLSGSSIKSSKWTLYAIEIIIFKKYVKKKNEY